jgi:hypothetical protein
VTWAPTDPAAETLPSALSPEHVCVRGIASTVELDYELGIAHKTYNPGFLVRALYWLAFQAPFPYVSNSDAVEAARRRRQIVGLLTRFWYGTDIVSPVVDIHQEEDGRIAFVTALVPGRPVSDRRRVGRFLKRLARNFALAGLPTWQISPFNPRAAGNLIEVDDGSFRIIDLESNIVAPLEPLSALVGAIRERDFPSFDDIHVGRLSEYIAANQGALKSALGEDYELLLASVSAYALHAGHWHQAEPRLPGRALRQLLRLVDFPTWYRALAALAARGHRQAELALLRALAQWSNEGRLSHQEADLLRAALSRPDLRLALTHFGVHLGMSVPLRFPLGSLARFSWTLTMRLRAEWRGLRGMASPQAEREVHTLLVALGALVPGLGAGAYLLSPPILANSPLGVIFLDRGLRKLPFGLYMRLRIGARATALVDRWLEGQHLDGQLGPAG